MSTKTPRAQPLQLPLNESADTAKHLIESADTPADDSNESAWLAEVEHRLLDNLHDPAAFSTWQTAHDRIVERLRSIHK